MMQRCSLHLHGKRLHSEWSWFKYSLQIILTGGFVLTLLILKLFFFFLLLFLFFFFETLIYRLYFFHIRNDRNGHFHDTLAHSEMLLSFLVCFEHADRCANLIVIFRIKLAVDEL